MSGKSLLCDTYQLYSQIDDLLELTLFNPELSLNN